MNHVCNASPRETEDSRVMAVSTRTHSPLIQNDWKEKIKKKSLWLVSSTLSCFESQSCVRVRLHVCVCWDERTHTANTFVRRWSSIWSLSTWAALSLKHTRASTPASAPLHVHQYTNICCQGWSFYFFNSCGLHLKKGQGCPAPFPGEVF